MPYTNYQSNAGFIVDPSSIERLGGYQIKWSEVDADTEISNNDGFRTKMLKAGTVMVEHPDRQIANEADSALAVDPIGILETDAYEFGHLASQTGYNIICGGVIYHNLLPESDGSTLPNLDDKKFTFQTYRNNAS